MSRGHNAGLHCAHCCAKAGGGAGITILVIFLCGAAVFGKNLTYILIGIATFIFVVILAVTYLIGRQFTRKDQYRLVLMWDTETNRPAITRKQREIPTITEVPNYKVVVIGKDGRAIERR